MFSPWETNAGKARPTLPTLSFRGGPSETGPLDRHTQNLAIRRSAACGVEHIADASQGFVHAHASKPRSMPFPPFAGELLTREPKDIMTARRF